MVSTANQAAAFPVMPDLKNLKVDLNGSKEKDAKLQEQIKEDELVAAASLSIDRALVEQHLQAFAYTRKEEDKMLEFATFHERPFDLEGNTITFKMDNELQVGQLNTVRGELVNYLKSAIGHAMRLESIIVAGEQKKMMYSPTDKFNYLADQFPDLHDLKKRLGLELDF